MQVKFWLITAFIISPNLVMAECLKSLAEMNKVKVKPTWVETTMDDGKPLTITIFEDAGRLLYVAKKVGVVWLNGEVCISKDGQHMTLKNTRPTKDVPFLARQVLPKTQSGKIDNDQVKLGGVAWKGTFQGI